MVAVLYSMNSLMSILPSPLQSQVLMMSSASASVMERPSLVSTSTSSRGDSSPSTFSSTALNSSVSSRGSSVRVPWWWSGRYTWNTRNIVVLQLGLSLTHSFNFPGEIFLEADVRLVVEELLQRVLVAGADGPVLALHLEGDPLGELLHRQPLPPALQLDVLVHKLLVLTVDLLRLSVTHRWIMKRLT